MLRGGFISCIQISWFCISLGLISGVYWFYKLKQAWMFSFPDRNLARLCHPQEDSDKAKEETASLLIFYMLVSCFFRFEGGVLVWYVIAEWV